MTRAHATHGELRVRDIAAPEPWQCFVLPVSTFPVPDAELRSLRELLSWVSQFLRMRHGLHSQIFLQLEHLHQEDGPSRLARNGRLWLPEMGLGVRPEHPAPTLWTKQDLENIEPGYQPRNLMDQMFRVAAGQDRTDHARDEMLGLGTVVELFSRAEPDRVLETGRQTYLPRMIEPAFQGFPFYVPLFSGATFGSTSASTLDGWACGVTACVRESPEDGGILFAADFPLRETVEQLLRETGGRR